MTQLTLSGRTVLALPAKTSCYIAYDAKLPGFGCRVTPHGVKSWIVEYRPNGGGRRASIDFGSGLNGAAQYGASDAPLKSWRERV